MKRTPLKRRTPLRSKIPWRPKRKRMNPFSERTRERNAKYQKQRTRFLRLHPICEVCWQRPSTMVHHKKGRLGPFMLDESTWLAVDAWCHDKIENKRDWAREHGFSLDRLATNNETRSNHAR